MQILLGLQFTLGLTVLMTLFSDFSPPLFQTTESPCEGTALAMVILAPSLKILPFSDLSQKKRHLAPHRLWPFLVTPPAPGVLIWARPSPWVVSMLWEAALASCRAGSTASTHAGPRARRAKRCLLPSPQKWHSPWLSHLAWLPSAKNSSLCNSSTDRTNQKLLPQDFAL